MAQPEKVRARISAIDERAARLRAEKSRLLARANQTERKRDTRRKILIGGAILAAVEHEGVPAMRSQTQLLQWLNGQLIRPHDRTVFDLAPQQHPAENAFGPYEPSARSEAAVKDADCREAPRSGAQRP